MIKIKFLDGFFLGILIIASLVFAGAVQANTSTSSQELVQTLQQQIETLKAKLAELNTQLKALEQAQEEAKEAAQDVKSTLKLIGQLKLGARGEQVKLLQEILATDPEIYPEKLITGYYGALTSKAVNKFQKKWGLDQVGMVGPKTLSRINEILRDGAGKSGKIPPGLLIAPGILKKLGIIATSTPPTPTSTPTSTPADVAAPVISDVDSTSTTASSSAIIWSTDETADSKVYYSTSSPVVIATASTSTIAALTLEHRANLLGLSASTTYYYLVSSADAAGNEATSSQRHFTSF